MVPRNRGSLKLNTLSKSSLYFGSKWYILRIRTYTIRFGLLFYIPPIIFYSTTILVFSSCSPPPLFRHQSALGSRTLSALRNRRPQLIEKFLSVFDANAAVKRPQWNDEGKHNIPGSKMVKNTDLPIGRAENLKARHF